MSRFWIEFHINRTAERFAGTDIDNFFLAEIYNAHAVLLFTDSYGKTYAKMLLQLTWISRKNAYTVKVENFPKYLFRNEDERYEMSIL